MVPSAHLNRILHQPLWLKTIIFVILSILLFIAWPLAVAAIYSLVVLNTLRQSKARLALVAAMITPALFMQFTWGQTIIANLQPAPSESPSTSKQLAVQPTSQPQVQGATTQQAADKVKVLQAVSGDTLDIDRDGQPYRVKLIGLQAPLMAAKSTGKAECFGPESQMFLDSLLRGRSVELKSDAVITDQSGLMIRYVIMDDGTQVNQLMLEAGLARPDTQVDHQLSAQFKAYAEAAKAAKKGLWLNCDKSAATPTPTPTPSIKSTPTLTITPRPTIETTVTPINPRQP